MIREGWGWWSGYSFECIFQAMLGWVFGEKFLQQPEQVESLRKASQNNPYPQSIDDQQRQLLALERFDGREGLSKIKAPALIMYGTEDIISFPAES